MKISRNILLKNYLLSRKFEVAGLIGLGMLKNILTLILPISLGKLIAIYIKKGDGNTSLDTVWGVGTTDDLTVTTFFVVLILLLFLSQYFYTYRLKALEENFSLFIKKLVFSAQLKTRYEVFLQKGHGRYLLRYSGDLTSTGAFLSKGVIDLFIDIVLLAIAFIWILDFNLTAGAIVICASVLLFSFLYWINQKLETISTKKRAAKSGLLAYTNRVLTHIYTIKVLNRNTRETGFFEKKAVKVKDRSLKEAQYKSFIQSLISLMQYVTLLAVVIHLSKDSANSKAEILGFIFMYLNLLPLFKRLLAVQTIHKLGNISFRKIIRIFEEDLESEDDYDEIKQPVKQLKLKNGAGNLELKTGKVNILSFENSSASSKFFHSFLKLTEKDLFPMYINGILVAGQNSFLWKKKVSVISGSVPLYGNTVAEAVTYSQKSEQIARAEKILHWFQKYTYDIQPLSIHTDIGEDGKKLSEVQSDLLKVVRGLTSGKEIIFVDQFNSRSAALNETLAQFLKKISDKHLIIQTETSALEKIKPLNMSLS